MEHLQFGPRYCETPDPVGGAFPIEPWNAISSGVICLFGLAGLYLVARRAPRAWPLHLLCALLVVNGAGSVLWHGLRTRWALTLDVQPALIFVALGALIWARRVAPLWQAATLAALVIGTPLIIRYTGLQLPLRGMMVANGLVIVLAAGWLIAKTAPLAPRAAATGGAALALALTALAFRSLDAHACAHFEHGSHFLWHIFLSSAAFMLLTTLIALEPSRNHLTRRA